MPSPPPALSRFTLLELLSGFFPSPWGGPWRRRRRQRPPSLPILCSEPEEEGREARGERRRGPPSRSLPLHRARRLPSLLPPDRRRALLLTRSPFPASGASWPPRCSWRTQTPATAAARYPESGKERREEREERREERGGRRGEEKRERDRLLSSF